MKRAMRWIYDWITVLTASLVGIPEILLLALQAFDDVDVSPWVGPELALQIVTGVAVAKAVLSLIESIARRA